MSRLDFVDRADRPFPLSLVFLIAFLVHGPLLLMQLPLKSYDTYFHIFFASHYAQHWFDPWNTKWYAGFSQTTYPPLPQQWIAVISGRPVCRHPFIGVGRISLREFVG